MGKRFPHIASGFLILGSLLAGSVLEAGPASPKQPVFVFLYARITDHVNVALSEDRLRHLLPALKQYRKDYPSANVRATVLFSGASSDALAARNGETHIVDFVKGYIASGVVEPGYDGENEPTYKTRPVLDFSNAKSLDDRWTLRARAADNILTKGRDPLTGATQDGKDGGLKRMQEVFGEAAYISGIESMLDKSPHPVTGAAPPAGPQVKHPLPTLFPETGGDSEALATIRSCNSKAIMVGLPEDNPGAIPGFGGGEEAFLKLISPDEQTAPEVYWQDNVLRLSEVSNTSEAAEEAQNEFKGLVADDLKDDLGELKRSRVQVVRVELADERYYLQPSYAKDDQYPLKYAYEHADSPKLPADELKQAKEVEAAYGREEEAIKWLAQEFFAANPGSRFVTADDLKEMAGPSAGYSVSMDALTKVTKYTLERWGNNTEPPSYLRVEDHYLSLADWFQMLADALAQLDHTGKLPESVRVVPVYGPMYTLTGHGPNDGEVTVASIAHAAAAISDQLHDTSPGMVPKNVIPVGAIVTGRLSLTSDAQGDIKMNSAQFLRLMARALVAESPDSKIPVRMTYMYPSQAILWPKTRAMTEVGAMWTVKPVILQIAGGSQNAQAIK